MVLQKFNAKSQKKQRTFITDRLRFLGDFYHNLKVLEVGGELIVHRRPQAGILVSYKDYMPILIVLHFTTKMNCGDIQKNVFIIMLAK